MQLDKDIMANEPVLNEAVFRAYVDVLNRRFMANYRNENIFGRENKSLHANATLSNLDSGFKKDIGIVSATVLAYLASQGYALVKMGDN